MSAGRGPQLYRAFAFFSLVTACLFATASFAEDAWRLHYTARLHGVPLVGADFCLQMSPTAYEASLSAHTLGLLDLLVHASSESRASGAIFPDGSIRPHDFADHGRLSGEDYAAAIGYDAGTPVLLHATPPQEKYRLPVPPSLLPHSIDGLAAVVMQSLSAAHGSCVDETVYDGRQLRHLSLHSMGQEQLDPNPRSAFAGRALRCETISTTLAGYLKTENPANQAKPRHGTLWLAALVHGGSVVPVRMVFDAEFFGDIVVQLDGAETLNRCAPGAGS